MGRCHAEILDIILIHHGCSDDASSASVLCLEGIGYHPLHISLIGHGNDNIIFRNQILCGHVIFVIADLCSSLIGIFAGNRKDFCSDHAKKHLLVGKDQLIFCNFFLKLFIFCLDFFSFQTCQGTKTHINDCLSLCI